VEERQRTEFATWNHARSKKRSSATTDELVQADSEIVDAEPSPDAFTRGVRQAGQAASRRVPVILGGVLVLAGLGAGFVAWQNHRTDERAKSTRAIAQASALFARGVEESLLPAERTNPNPPPYPVFKDESDRREQFAAEMAKLEEAGSDDARTLRHLLLAGQAMRERKWSEAITGYDAFLNDAAADHPLRPLALDGRVLARENNGDLAGALADAQALSADAMPESGRSLGRWHEARILALQGQSEGALAKLKAIVDDPESSELAHFESAKYLVARLEAGEKIEYPPLVIPEPSEVKEPVAEDAAQKVEETSAAADEQPPTPAPQGTAPSQ
jgi:hypothetical protein